MCDGRLCSPSLKLCLSRAWQAVALQCCCCCCGGLHRGLLRDAGPPCFALRYGDGLAMVAGDLGAWEGCQPRRGAGRGPGSGDRRWGEMVLRGRAV